MIKRLLNYLYMIISGCYRFVKDYVIPVINFVTFLKELLEREIEGKDVPKAYDKKFLKDILKISEDFLDRLVSAFVASVKILLPDLAPSSTTYIVVIKNFMTHMKELEPAQRTMILFKIASFMLMQLTAKTKDSVKEYEADLMVQIAYSYSKNKRLG